MTEPSKSVKLPELDVTQEDELRAKIHLADEYKIDWQSLAESCADYNRATDILMDLTSTEAALLCRERQLLASEASRDLLLEALKACQLQLLQSNNNSEYAKEANEMARAAIKAAKEL